jgi:hypothetical protein
MWSDTGGHVPADTQGDNHAQAADTYTEAAPYSGVATVAKRLLHSPDIMNRPFQFQKRAELFIAVHNKAPSIVAVCVYNPDF